MGDWWDAVAGLKKLDFSISSTPDSAVSVVLQSEFLIYT